MKAEVNEIEKVLNWVNFGNKDDAVRLRRKLRALVRKVVRDEIAMNRIEFEEKWGFKP